MSDENMHWPYWLDVLLGVLVGFLLGLSALLSFGQAQASMAKGAPWGGPFYTAFVEDSAREVLEATWDEKNPAQVERVFCIMSSDVRVDTSSDRSAVELHVHDLTAPVDVSDATPYQVSFHCPQGFIGSIHTHLPTTCVRPHRNGRGAHSCIMGGPDAWVCSVDEEDRLDASTNKEMMSGVQCDKHAVVWYFRNKRGQ